MRPAVLLPWVLVVLVVLVVLGCGLVRAADFSGLQNEPHDPGTARQDPDRYAWQLFAALTRPVSSKPGTSGPENGVDGPAIWETWPDANQVFRRDGADPGPWDSHLAVVRTLDRFESGSLKELPNLRRAVSGTMAPVAEPLAVARRLTEVHFNRAAYDYIRAGQLYCLEGQERAYRDGLSIAFPGTAKTIKAQWRPIRAEDRSRYHAVQITLANGSTRLYGLTALHIATKDLGNWFWATFEHVDNPALADGEGWLRPSRDTFACKGARPDCNRLPSGLGLERSVWSHYRLRGTMTSFVDAAGTPELLANSELESGMQATASCMTCHARSSLAMVADQPLRLPVLDAREPAAGPPGERRRSYFGLPDPAWYSGDKPGQPQFRQLDFIWSLALANPTRH